MNKLTYSRARPVLDCASPLALLNAPKPPEPANRLQPADAASRAESGRGLPHSKTLARPIT